MILGVIWKFLQNEIAKERHTLVPVLPLFGVLGIILFFRYNIRPEIAQLYIFLAMFGLSFALKVPYISSACLACFFVVLGVYASKYRLDNLEVNGINITLENVTVRGVLEQVSLGLDKDKIIIKTLFISDYKRKKYPQRLQFKVPKELGIQNLGLKIDDVIEFRANIFPLPRPIYPDAYNFADIAKFKGIGGIGLVKSSENYGDFHIKIYKESQKTSFGVLIERARLYIDKVIGERMKYSDSSGVSMALFTGNTGYIQRQTVLDIQKSGLSHLLAISGINISIVAITTFAIIRRLLRYSTFLSVKYDIKKLAAMLAVIISFFHLQISGLPISAVRSFIMFTLGLLCIFLDRPATPMRIVSFTLFVIIMQKPEGVFDPSLQMSFMAVLGLIASMGYFSRIIDERYGDGGRFIKLLIYFAGIFASSLVSTFATFCYSVYHFNQYSNVGLISNILAVPISELGMIPLGVIGIFTSLLGIGLDYPFFKLMEWCGDAFVKIAKIAAKMDYSAILVPEMPMQSLFFYTLGLLMLFTLVSKFRFAGLVFMALGIFLHAKFPKPIAVIGKNYHDMIVTIDGKYYAVGEFSSEFLKTIWLGRLGKKSIPIMEKPMYDKYFTSFPGGFSYFSKDMEIHFILDGFDEKMCNFAERKRLFIVDKLGGYGTEYLCTTHGKFRPKIIRNWTVNRKGALVIR